jgi:hypothetical protein
MCTLVSPNMLHLCPDTWTRTGRIGGILTQAGQAKPRNRLTAPVVALFNNYKYMYLLYSAFSDVKRIIFGFYFILLHDSCVRQMGFPPSHFNILILLLWVHDPTSLQQPRVPFRTKFKHLKTRRSSGMRNPYQMFILRDHCRYLGWH